MLKDKEGCRAVLEAMKLAVGESKQPDAIAGRLKGLTILEKLDSWEDPWDEYDLEDEADIYVGDLLDQYTCNGRLTENMYAVMVLDKFLSSINED